MRIGFVPPMIVRMGLLADDPMVERFLRDGYVRIEGAFSDEVARECERLLWVEIGLDRGDPATWTEPVHRVGAMARPVFTESANTPLLRDAFDRLVGVGRWAPLLGMGAFPLRFPHADEPDDAGWHIDGSITRPESRWPYANVVSEGRALLMLFLYTDVGPHDAPTRIRVGSHLDVPTILARYGDEGASVLDVAAEIDTASAHRPLAYATGSAGDVYLCHPFLVHAAQPHHGTRPRFLAQPPLYPAGPHRLDRADAELSPVEIAIRRGLGR